MKAKRITTMSVILGEELFTLNNDYIKSRYDHTPYETDGYGDIVLCDAPYGLLAQYGNAEGNDIIKHVVNTFNGK